jgi:hypothetical protein
MRFKGAPDARQHTEVAYIFARSVNFMRRPDGQQKLFGML